MGTPEPAQGDVAMNSCRWYACLIAVALLGSASGCIKDEAPAVQRSVAKKPSPPVRLVQAKPKQLIPLNRVFAAKELREEVLPGLPLLQVVQKPVPAPEDERPVAPEVVEITRELTDWERIWKSNKIDDFKEHLKKYPDGDFAPYAQAAIARLSQPKQ